MNTVLTFFLGLAWCFSTLGQSKIKLVIDAGHGGKDVGHEAEFSGHQNEKHLTLKITKLIGGYFDKYTSNVEVIYTRTGDKTVSLDDRVEIGNSKKVDYFLSIHCNGADNHRVRGTESIVHTWNSKKALGIAKNIENQFKNRAGRHSRGVKNKDDLKHSLQVLKYTKMPSVVVECGFLSNRREANYLNTTHGQEMIASAIFRGMRDFLVANHPKIDFKKSKKKGTYSIQIMSSKSPLKTDSPRMKKLGLEVRRIKLNTKSAYKYIYLAGNFDSKEAAQKELKNVQKRGFKDAIIRKE